MKSTTKVAFFIWMVLLTAFCYFEHAERIRVLEIQTRHSQTMMSDWVDTCGRICTNEHNIKELETKSIENRCGINFILREVIDAKGK